MQLETVIEAKAEALDEEPLNPGSAPTFLPRWLSHLTMIVLSVLLVAMPLWFGAVHEPAYLSARFLILALLFLALCCAPAAPFAIFRSRTFSFSALVGFSLVFLYATLQFLDLTFFTSFTHPILGTVRRHPAPLAGWNALAELSFFLASFVVVRLWLARAEHHAKRLCNVILAVGLLVSITALSHWFADNGKLFWTFGPESQFISTRARWPFVNANSLAQFLLPFFFLLLAKVVDHISGLRRHSAPDGLARKRTLHLVLSNKRLQYHVVWLSFTAAIMLAVLLCIVGSGSRAAWFALACGLLLFITLLNLMHRHQTRSAQTHAEQAAPYQEISSTVDLGPHGATPARKHRRRTLHREPINWWQIASRLSTPALVAASLLLFYLYLQGRGMDLFLDRLDYGLMYSKDDMRWQLYSDSLAMTHDTPWFGVGLGAWSAVYPRYMNAALSGVNPVYLHSDPLQYLVETGIAGSLLLLGTLGVLFTKALRYCFSNNDKSPVLVLGLALGLLSLAISSFFDFPFRIPATVFFVAIYLALLSYRVDAK